MPCAPGAPAALRRFGEEIRSLLLAPPLRPGVPVRGVLAWGVSCYLATGCILNQPWGGEAGKGQDLPGAAWHGCPPV